MPTGSNLNFNFDTGTTYTPNQYPFVTDSSGGVPSVPIEMSASAYHGASGTGLFHVQLEYSFGLCEYQENYNNTIDFSVQCRELSMVHGHSFSVDVLTTEPGKRVNLSLCEYSYNLNASGMILEYGPCQDTIVFGAHFELELTTPGRRLGTRYDLPLCCPYETPSQPIFVFDDTECAFFHAIDHACCNIDDLITDPRDSRANDIELCYGFTAVSPDTDPATEFDPATEYNFQSYDWIYEFNPAVGCFEMEFATDHFAGSDFEVDLFVEKGTGHDFNLCADEINPPLDYSEQDPHDFLFKSDYLYECGGFRFTAYHGASGTVAVLKPVELSNIVGFHGHYSTSTFMPFQNFIAPGYSGGRFEFGLTTFEAVELDLDFYNGQWATAEVSIKVILYDVDGIHGALTTADLDVSKPIELDINTLHGNNSNVELLTIPVFGAIDGYTGAAGESDLTIFPSIFVDADGYHGALSDATLYVNPGFIVRIYNGASASTGFVTAPSSGAGVFTSYHGAFSDASMNVTFAMYGDAVHGHYADAQLATDVTLDFDMIGGEVGDTDFTTFGPPTIIADAHHGSNTNVAMNVTPSFHARAYNGSVADSTLTVGVSADFSFSMYHGSNGIVDELLNDVWNFFGYHGAIADAGVAITVNFGDTHMYHGAYAPDININMDFVALDCDAAFGSRGQITMYVPPGPELEAEGWHGQNFEAIPTILIYTTFEARFVHDLAMRDGGGHAGGLNHCYSEKTTCAAKYKPFCEIGDHNDSVIRFPFPESQRWEDYESDLNIIFDETGFSPFNVCNSHHNNGHFEFDLYTRARFEFDAHHGATLEAYTDRELLSFGDVPLDILYSEDGFGNRHDHHDDTFQSPYLQPRGFYGSNAFISFGVGDEMLGYTGATIAEFELDVAPLWDFMPNGQTGYVEYLTVAKPDWRNGIKPFTYHAGLEMEFEPVNWTRFCPGYIVPIGSAVVLEFGSEEETGCSIYAARHGAHAQCDVACQFYPVLEDAVGGAALEFILTLDPAWELKARGGELFSMASQPEFEIHFPTAQNFSMKFIEEVILAAYGDALLFDELVVPGPGIGWITEPGCLPNQYIPLTEDGDPDYAALEPDEHGVHHFVDAPVEGQHYFTALVATCLTYAQPDEES